MSRPRDHEIENAQEWETDTVVSEPPQLSRADKVTTSLPQQQQGTASAAHIPNSGGRDGFGIIAIGQKYPDGISTNNGYLQDEARALSRSRAKKQAFLKNAGPEGVDSGSQGESGKPWPKTILVSTAQNNKKTQQERETARQLSLLSGNPSSSTLQAAGLFLWPLEYVSPYEILGADLHLLEPIRKEFDVFIDWQEDIHSIRIRSDNPKLKHLDESLAAVLNLVRECQAQSEAEAPIYLVRAPSVIGMRNSVSPTFESDSLGNSQPSIVKVNLTGKALGKEDLQKWANDRDLIDMKHRHVLMTSVRDMLEKLASLRTGLKLRVHLGRLTITSYRKDFKDESYTYLDLSKMMESKAKARLNKDVGGTRVAANILRRINEHGQEIFEPVDACAIVLEDVKERQDLIIILKAPSGELIRIEAEVDAVRTPKVVEYEQGTTNYFRHVTMNNRLDISVLDLETTSDWCLQVSTTNKLVDEPIKLADLVKYTIRGITHDREDGQGLNYPAVTLKSHQGLTIDNVLIRATRQYALTKFPGMVMDFSIYRNWAAKQGAQLDTIQEPLTTCGVTIYNKEWDADMGLLDGTQPRVWYSDLKMLVEGRPEGEKAFYDFLDGVAKVRTFLDSSFL